MRLVLSPATASHWPLTSCDPVITERPEAPIALSSESSLSFLDQAFGREASLVPFPESDSGTTKSPACKVSAYPCAQTPRASLLYSLDLTSWPLSRLLLLSLHCSRADALSPSNASYLPGTARPHFVLERFTFISNASKSNS